jgi:hypothetical protein
MFSQDNQFDANGKKHGRWVEYLSNTFKRISDSTKASYWLTIITIMERTCTGSALAKIGSIISNWKKAIHQMHL